MALNIFEVFFNRKMSALLFLGFASGLPFFLTGQTLQAWMTTEGVDLEKIGFISLAALPYSLKFFWSPLLDRYRPPLGGRRRGWLLLTQLGLILAIGLMGTQNPRLGLQLLALNAVVVAFLSATQDIAADAYRTDILEEPEMGAGVAVFVLGYRAALLATGSLALILADKLPWGLVYGLMALLMSLGLLATWWAPEPQAPAQMPATLFQAVVEPFQDFFQRKGVQGGLLILLFIVLYKLGDAIANNMSTPFLLQIGFSQADIGAIKGGMGLLATIVGTLAGGVFLNRWGINRSLWIFGAVQALSNLSYVALANLGQNYPAMVLTINLENFSAGLGTSAFLAFFMSLCNREYSATQYALLSSLYAFSQNIVVSPAGVLAKNTGWPLFFLLSFLASLPGLALLPIFAPWQDSLPSLGRPGAGDFDGS